MTFDRYRTPLGDRRERPVPCRSCRRDTFALDAMCDECFDEIPSYRATRIREQAKG